MFKKLASYVNYTIGWGSKEDDISDDETDPTDILIDQIMANILSKDEKLENIPNKPVSSNVLKTQHRIGKVTNLSQNDGVIDGKYFFDRRDAPSEGLDIGKSVTYHAFRNSEEQEWRVTKILAIHEETWDAEDEGDVPEVEAEPRTEEENVVQENTANKRTIVGRVQVREGREVIVRDYVQRLKGGTVPRDTRFNLDDVASEFTPLRGDIVCMDSIVEVSEETVDGSGDVVQVLSIKPSRARISEGVVTNWIKNRRCGDVNGDVYFERDACESGYLPRTKDEVKMEVIECEREKFKWRAISVKPMTLSQHQEYTKPTEIIYRQIDPELLQNKGNLIVQNDTDFKALPAVGNYRIEISVTNEGETPKVITKHYVEAEPSNLKLISPKTKTVRIEPQDTVIFSFDYNRTMCGFNSEVFVIECSNFQIGRLIKWQVFTGDIPEISPQAGVKDVQVYQKTRHEMAQRYMQVKENPSWVPGVRPSKPPSFVKYRIPIFPMPDAIKKAMTSGREGSFVCRKDAAKALKENYPELDQQLSSINHLRRFHQLLYIAEMDALIDLCRYSKERVSFTRRGQCSEYLALEVPGLAEGRPSLLIGDSVIASNSGVTNGAILQGFVHRVLSNEVWLKFNAQFHNTYNSEDCDVYFELSRGCFRRCHAALDMCHSNQANLWLFPKGVRAKPPQVALQEDFDFPLHDLDLDVDFNSDHEDRGDSSITGDKKSVQNFFESFKSSPEKIEKVNGEFKHVDDIENSFIKVNGAEPKVPSISPNKNKTETADAYSLRRKKLVWVNKKLNHRQKEAARNILLGEARPLPYIIFGPPGTGKTMTLVETILQIYLQITDSRILIATPSNSSANLIAERLLDSNILQPGDMVRLVANHLIVDGKIPPKIVPYSATIDTSASAQETSEPDSKGFPNMCGNLIKRHRITIGTCVALGQIVTLGFPRGHYTHVAVDEAGQATEPEILIPLSFLAHESGQAILAGDPNQLGPVVPSHLAADLGLSKSLLARLLPRFPYQRDPTGFPESGGYDPRLVTRLTVNYRSLPDILELPSSLFYDSDLEAWISEEDSYESKVMARATAHLNLPSSAVVFRGIKGSTYRDSDSPSYWNPHECLEVIQYVRQLLDAQIKREDIGIITPYQKQAMKIKHLLEKLDIGDKEEMSGIIKVGSVEEFQGQERMVIILSTVRSVGGGHVESIGRNTAKQLLGFVNNPERLNVAISRARALLIICGDPEVLCIDYYWRNVVKYCVDRKSYIGTAIPKHLLEN